MESSRVTKEVEIFDEIKFRKNINSKKTLSAKLKLINDELISPESALAIASVMEELLVDTDAFQLKWNKKEFHSLYYKALDLLFESRIQQSRALLNGISLEAMKKYYEEIKNYKDPGVIPAPGEKKSKPVDDFFAPLIEDTNNSQKFILFNTLNRKSAALVILAIERWTYVMKRCLDEYDLQSYFIFTSVLGNSEVNKFITRSNYTHVEVSICEHLSKTAQDIFSKTILYSSPNGNFKELRNFLNLPSSFNCDSKEISNIKKNVIPFVGLLKQAVAFVIENDIAVDENGNLTKKGSETLEMLKTIQANLFVFFQNCQNQNKELSHNFYSLWTNAERSFLKNIASLVDKADLSALDVNDLKLLEKLSLGQVSRYEPELNIVIDAIVYGMGQSLLKAKNFDKQKEAANKASNSLTISEKSFKAKSILAVEDTNETQRLSLEIETPKNEIVTDSKRNTIDIPTSLKNSPKETQEIKPEIKEETKQKLVPSASAPTVSTNLMTSVLSTSSIPVSESEGRVLKPTVSFRNIRETKPKRSGSLTFMDVNRSKDHSDEKESKQELRGPAPK